MIVKDEKRLVRLFRRHGRRECLVEHQSTFQGGSLDLLSGHEEQPALEAVWMLSRSDGGGRTLRPAPAGEADHEARVDRENRLRRGMCGRGRSEHGRHERAQQHGRAPQAADASRPRSRSNAGVMLRCVGLSFCPGIVTPGRCRSLVHWVVL